MYGSDDGVDGLIDEDGGEDISGVDGLIDKDGGKDTSGIDGLIGSTGASGNLGSGFGNSGV